MSKFKNFEIYRKFAVDLILKSGELILKEKSKLKILKHKDILDIATSADMASEQLIISNIKSKFPNHSIYSEEMGEDNKDSEFRWIIDPLDGTKEFARDIPLWNVSLALEHNGILVASALFRPQEKSLFSSSLNEGSFKESKKIKTSSNKSLENSFIYCYIPSYKRNEENYDQAFNKLQKLGKKVYRLRGLSDENTAMCWVAQGSIDAYINLSNQPKWHDVAPGILIAKEAGAIVDRESYPLIVCSNKTIYNQLLKAL